MSDFERMVEFYAEGSVPWDQPLPPPELIDTIATMRSGHALDLGCGYGRASRTMADHGWHVTAVDFVPSAIVTARERSTAYPSISYHLGRVTDLHFLRPPYDFALDVGCGHSLEDDELVQYTNEVARLVRPNGLFLLYGRLRDQDETETSPRGFIEAEIVRLLEQNFVLERMEQGITAVRDETWQSVWFWWRKR